MEIGISQGQNINKDYRLWSINQIGMAALIAGPLGGCLFLGQNYKHLGFVDSAKKCYIAGILVSFLLCICFALIPDEIFSHIPTFMIPTSIFLTMKSIADSYQKDLINEKRDNGTERYPYGWAFLVSLSLAVICAPIFFLIGYFLGSLFYGG